MLGDSMEFLYMYRCRLSDAGIDDTAYRDTGTASKRLGGKRPVHLLHPARVTRAVPRFNAGAPTPGPGAGQALLPRFRHLMTRLLGRFLTALGRLLVLVGERISAAGPASDGVPSHG